MSKSKVLFFVTGSVAAFKAAAVVSRLVRDGYEVQCVMSGSALRFVGEATLEGLTGKRVLKDLWESGRAMDHIHFSRWADFGIVCPASANTLARMALGLADDVVAACLLAWPRSKPLYVFPAMNSEMLAAAPTQSHINSLRSRGVFVAESPSGTLACGETGDGRLLEPEEIVRLVRHFISPEGAASSLSARHRRILITSGATRESIDGVRFITNHSTGRTGAELAEFFASAGWLVTLLHGQGAMKPSSSHGGSERIHLLEYSDHADLCEKMASQLGSIPFAAAIHCAAVSDYTVGGVSHSNDLLGLGPKDLVGKKISSTTELTLRLLPTKKILPLLREFSINKGIKVVGFKMTLNSTREEMLAAASRIFDESVDAVVANDWAEVCLDRSKHPGVLRTRANEVQFESVSDLAAKLSGLFEEVSL